jgi:hypothetical protein
MTKRTMTAITIMTRIMKERMRKNMMKRMKMTRRLKMRTGYKVIQRT